MVAALSASGLQARTYRFLGFLPREAGPLRRLFDSLALEPDTVVAFESPNRAGRALRLLAETLPDRRVAVCRELTKLHEEFFVGTPAEAIQHFSDFRGEFVLIIEGAPTSTPAAAADEDTVREELARMRALGLTRAQAAALLEGRHKVPRRRLYRLWLDAG